MTARSSSATDASLAQRWRRLSLKTYLVFVILIATLPLVGLIAYRVFDESRHQRVALVDSLQTTARAIATALDREIGASRDALHTLAQADSLQRGDLVSYGRGLRHHAPLRPAWSRVALLREDGSLAFDFDQANNGQESNASKNDIAALMRAWSAHPEGEFLVSVLDVLPTRRGTWIAVPAPLADGTRQLLAARVGLDRWQALLLDTAPSGGFVGLFDQERRVIARTLVPDRFVGMRLPTAAIAGMGSATSGHQTIELREGGDAQAAWQLLPDYDWGVEVGMPTTAFDAAERSAGLWTLGATAGCLLLGTSLSLLIARRVSDPLSRLLVDGGYSNRERVAVTEVASLRDAFAQSERARATASLELASLMEREQRARADAEAASHVKDEILSMLGHELRNPLNAIVTSVEVLRSAPPASTMADRARDVLARKTQKLTTLIDDLLDAGRVMSDDITLSPQPLDLYALAQTGVAAAQRRALERRQHITLAPQVAIWAQVDARRMGEVLMHLLRNAMQRTQEGGTITVTVRRIGELASLQVADGGQAIAHERLHHVFEPRDKREPGFEHRTGDDLGVGLTLVKRLVDLHGGRVQVLTSPDGSVFECQLPGCEPPRATQITLAQRIV